MVARPIPALPPVTATTRPRRPNSTGALLDGAAAGSPGTLVWHERLVTLESTCGHLDVLIGARLTDGPLLARWLQEAKELLHA